MYGVAMRSEVVAEAAQGTIAICGRSYSNVIQRQTHVWRCAMALQSYGSVSSA
jgi:hypothetical protein